MNDSTLIELVLESPIDDLTVEQIQAIRARLPESTPLREALSERLQMDHHLVDVLGASGDTPDEFVQKVLQRKQRQSSRSRWSLGFALALVVLVGVSTAAVYQFALKKDSPEIAQSENSDTTVVDEEPAGKTAPDEPSPPPATAENPNRSSDPPLDVETQEDPSTEQPAEPSSTNDQEQQQIDALVPRDVEPITFSHLTSLPDADRRDSLTRSQFEQWFAKASDKLPATIEEFRDGDRPQTRMKGWFRLRGQLPQETALRFELSDIHRVRFHFYCGDRGITVVRHQHDYSPWYAYATERSDNGVQPKNLLLEANDGYREHRGPARHYKPVTFYFDEQSRELVFYRGDVEVIRAPLPHTPDEIYFEGESIVRQVNLWPLQAFPDRQEQYPVQVRFDRPADLPWQSKLAEQTKLVKNENGTVSIVAQAPQDRSWICMPIPGYGPRMVELELSGVDRSHGVFLTKPPKRPEEGKTPEVPSPHDGLVFNENRKTGNLYARFSYIWDSGHHVDRNPLEHPSTEVGDHVWVRLLHGAGQIRGWISRDGQHWALLSSEDNDTKEVYNFVGLTSDKVDGDHKLTIEKVVVRALPGLTDLFPKEHWEKVDQIPWDQLDGPPYSEEPFELPNGSELATDLASRIRRYTCTPASYDHMTQLCTEAMDAASSIDAKKQVLKDFLALTKTWPLDYHEKRFIGWSEEALGDLFVQQLRTPERQGLAEFRRELLNLPSMNRDPFSYFSQERFNAEILAAIQQNRWDDIIENCETLRLYYSYDSRKLRSSFPIINWAGGIAVRHTQRGNQIQDYLTEGRSTSMLVEDLSKEAYNISAELNAALDSGAIADACRLITQIPESAAEGLAPSGSDPDHLYSVPAAIQMAVQSHDALHAQMEKEHADIAQLRVNAAIQRGDRRVVELVTLQFFDTQAAAQAHLWLGDQATSAGDFATSLQHYMKAARSANRDLKPIVAARLEMLGHASDADDATTSTSIPLGSETISANSLLNETEVIRASFRSPDEETSSDAQPADQASWPTDAELAASEFVLRGMWGRDKDRVPTDVRDRREDWRGRNLGMTISGDQAFLCNRFETWKVDLKNNKEIWKQSERDKDRGKAFDFPFTQAVPLLTGDLVVTRMLHEKGFALYGLDRESGEVRWATNLDGQLVLATDPISVQGRVVIVTLREISHAIYAVRMSRVDLATGEILDSQPLFQIRETWFDRGIGKIVAHREQLLLDLGGVLASCDISGHLQWVRKQLTFPQKIDGRWASQDLSNLQLIGQQAISFHAGMLNMECIDAATGNLRWTFPAAEVQSVQLLDQETLLVEAPQQWSLLSTDSGEATQVIAKPEDLLSWCVNNDSIIGLVRKDPAARDGEALLQVVKISLQDGSTDSLQSMEISAKETPAAGPLFFGGEKWHFWFNEDQNQDDRKLMTLK